MDDSEHARSAAQEAKQTKDSEHARSAAQEAEKRSVLLALVGATASGKSRMAVEVAVAMRGRGRLVEIVSCDSMGVYRGLDIAADKPAETARRGIPHHMFDVASPEEPFTAVRYREEARRVIAEIRARGAVPLLVGGSGLWFRAVVDDLLFAPSDAAVRSRLASEGPAELLDRLRAADPETAARLDPRNARRIVRAVEILELTGRPPAELRDAWERRAGRGGLYELAVAGLTWDRAELYARAERRVHEEVLAGLVDEVARVRRTGLSHTARQALGVKEVLEHLEGRATLEEATQTLVRNTKGFVRRQLSWFRADPRVEWVNASELGWEGARAEMLRLYESAAS